MTDQPFGSPDDDRSPKPFTPETLDKAVIAIPLLHRILANLEAVQAIIIDLNLDYPGGREGARDQVRTMAADLGIPSDDRSELPVAMTADGMRMGVGLHWGKSLATPQYLFAALRGHQIQELARRDYTLHDPGARSPNAGRASQRAIYKIWPDFEVRPLITRSISTVKADAAGQSFSALGEGIVWAVLDSGIDDHPHWTAHNNLTLDPPLEHRDFTGANETGTAARRDDSGHGTHVAGIIAGERRGASVAVTRHFAENGSVRHETESIDGIAGMAPKCKLVSYRIIDGQGRGLSSNAIAALAHIQEINGYGRRLRITGVNMSVGYDFEPEWFACGQSPLCVEVNRLVKSGVVVVVAAGNTGYGYEKTAFRGTVAAGLALTIMDPGNAEFAITVGSTHRDMPHLYGVSYFSSKGPTGDGRLKPDLVAPGEKIISCAVGQARERSGCGDGQGCDYVEDSGTSMAAPHVSGVIAAFLSVRREFIGQPERVKDIFLRTTTDLRRDRYFQGAGLIDLMRAIQSV